MRFTEDQDHLDLRRSVRAYLAQHVTIDQVRRFAEADPEGSAVEGKLLWHRLCADLDLAGMCLPTEVGGQGAPSSYLAVVLEELGRALAPTPMMSSVVLAATALLESGDEEAVRRWVPSIASGELVATIATTERPHDWGLQSIRTTAVPDGERWLVTGAKPWVSDGASADLVLVLATTEHGPTLFAVPLPDASVSRESVETLDRTRPMARMRFDCTVGLLVGRPGEGRRVLEATLRRAGVALAAEQLGGAARTLEMALDQARRRVQFGRPIGSFQAIKHMLADRHVEIEGLKAAVRHTAVALDALPEECELLSHLCQAVASEVFLDVAGTNIQVHGGLGFTWDHDAHLYFKRATASRQWLGTSEHHREQVAALMLDSATSAEEHPCSL